MVAIVHEVHDRATIAPLSVREDLEPCIGQKLQLLLQAVVGQIAAGQHRIHLPGVQLPKRLLEIGLLLPIGNVDVREDAKPQLFFADVRCRGIPIDSF